VNEPECWSWPLPAILTREQEIERLEEESLALCRDLGSMDHYLTPGACRLITWNWPQYLLTSWHSDRCAVCGVETLALAVDHDHHSGLVRGLLCRGCNLSEGTSRNEVYDLYRQRPPALILGTRFFYTGRGWPDDWWCDERLARRLTSNREWTQAEATLVLQTPASLAREQSARGEVTRAQVCPDIQAS
jgi:hypothetical protein